MLSPYPAKAELARRRIPLTHVAKASGYCPAWVGRVLNGYVKPPTRLIEAVADLTGLPAEALFPADAPVTHVVMAVLRSRLEQGLPPTVEDPTTLAKVATLMGTEQ